MAPLRCLFLLAVIAAVSAQTATNSLDLSDSVEAVTKNIEGQIANVHGAGSNAVRNVLEKIKDLIKTIQERIQKVQKSLLQSLKDTSENMAGELNDVIQKWTGMDLNLDDKWKDFELKTAKCSGTFKTELKQTLESIKEKAQSCSSAEISDVKAIGDQIGDIVEILQTVPAETMENLKSCDEGESSPSNDDKPDDKPDNLFAGFRFPGSNIFKKAQCIFKGLWTAFEKLKPTAEDAYNMSKEIRELTDKTTREAMKKCAESAVSGQGEVLRKSAAQLAYCVIA